MAHRRWARTFGVVIAVALWLCLGLALPIVLSLYSSDMASDAVEAAPGDAFTISQPVALSTAPGVRIDRGTVAFVDASGNVLSSSSAGNASPVQPSQNLRLYNALVSFGPEPETATAKTGAAPSFPTSPYIEALAGSRFETLSLRRTTLVLHGLFETPESLTDVKADVSLRRRGFISIKGSAFMRGHRVHIDALANVGQGERRGALLNKVPLKLSIKGENIDFHFDGRMMPAADQIELAGQADLALPSGRSLARWFGSYWPAGPGLQDVSVKGQIRVSRQKLAFENAAVRMDGNEGAGVIGLRLTQPRPVVTGTLAYKTLDARPYLSTTQQIPTDGFSWSSLAAGALTVPLGLHLDADMRISADRVQFGTFELGRLATTIALKDGRLLADIADMKFNGGEGGGQISADFSGFVPKVTIRGKLDQIDLSLLSGSLGGGHLLSGKASVVADLLGSAATMSDLFRGMAGKIAVSAQSPGKIGMDLKGMADSVKAGAVTGWSNAAPGSTDYDALDLRLVLRDGTILTEVAETKSSDGGWTAVGVANLLSDRIDLRLSQASPRSGPAAALAAPQRVLELHGPLSAPRLSAGSLP